MKTHLIINSKKLSPREKQVAIYIADGLSTKKIAELLGIKPNTVSTFKKNIFVKIKLGSNVEIYKIFLNH
jgi:DNA-binding CsgD family transcriptional regulator